MAISKDNLNTPKSHYASQIFLRILAIATTLSAACLMITNKQATLIFGIQVVARYSYSPAFKFYAFANIAAFALSVLSLIAVFLMERKPLNSTFYFCLFLHDLTVTVLLMAGLGAAMAIAYVGKFGNSHSGWMQICDHFGKFCNRVIASSVVGFLGLFVYLILTIVSANQSRKIPPSI
ncbi:CASP-like protein 1F1 isoform X2 [Salvia splendens]|uniref:CASP-like protein 1F1 isoform X2 n=1 Tax=Salvia splendens TaxID=180675 RepID=UPI001103F65D|nr:CASP-like protein 1F1 isoform X2 [Salvia splendens]